MISRAPKIDVGVCARLIADGQASCHPANAIPPTPPGPSWEPLANSFASLSAAFAWGALFLGLLALVAGVAWANYVKVIAEREAREAAQKCANEIIVRWLANEGPQIIREHVEFLQPTVGNNVNDAAAAADAMGTGA